MFALVSRIGERPWVSAVVSDTQNLVRAQGAARKNVPNATHFLIQIPVRSFPVYLIEWASGEMEWGDVLHVQRAINGIVRDRDAEKIADPGDWCYCTVFTFESEWMPLLPGYDQMGRLPHTHIDSRWFERPEHWREF